jgi:hypothetical protein
MTEQNGQAQAPWTEEEAAAFAQRLVTFGEELPPRERDAFTAILATVTNQDSADGDDAQGYFWQGLLAAAIVTAADKLGAFDAIDWQHPPTTVTT